MLSPEKAREIRREANQLLDDIGISTYPVDPEEIAKAKRLSVEYVDGMPRDVYGALWRKDNRYGIIVSNQCPTDGLRRFTLAHELGHYMLPEHAEKMFRKDDEQVLSLGGNYRRKDPLEVEADTFASELLLPERFVRSAVGTSRPTLDGIIGLSTSFLVSVSAAAIRATELTDEPMAVILSRDGRCEWCARSASLAQHGWALRSLKNDRVPQGSATGRLASDVTRVKQGYRDDETMSLSRWFDDAPADLHVIEDAVGLGSYGRVLTTLTFDYLPDVDELYIREQRQQRERGERQNESTNGWSPRGDQRRGIGISQWDEDE